MPKIKLISYIFVALFIHQSIFANSDSLYAKIQAISKQAKGKVSIAASILEDSSSFSFYGDELCVMQSVFKFPIALAVLDRIDKNEFSLKHKIHITPKEMIKDIWSPLRDSFPNGNINVSFEDLIKYMVSQSDNIACDVLIKHLGKPKIVQKYIQKFNVYDFMIKYNEVTMQKKWKNQYQNVCSPNAMVSILTQFYNGKFLSETNTTFLYQVMLETTTGKNRIVNLLPNGTKVAHKTGSSGTNENGMTAAVNDVGIITLPNGKHLAIAIFVNDSYADYVILEKTIAETAKTIYEYYANE